MENIYPVLPGVPRITNTSGIAEYASYFFTLGIMVAGILAAVMLVIGATKILTSAGNPSHRREGIDTVKNSILGLVLIVSSYMLLQTINPVFITPNLTPLPPGDGIFYTNGTDIIAAPMSESNVQNAPPGYNQIIHKCSTNSVLYMWSFAYKNFDATGGVIVSEIACGFSQPVPPGSFKLAYKTPGIYFFAGENCSGNMSQAITGTGSLPDPFKNNAKSFKIVENPSAGAKYGIILHGVDDASECIDCVKEPSKCSNFFACVKDPSETGHCSVPYFISDPALPEKCFSPIPNLTVSDPEHQPLTVSASATVFMKNVQDLATSGTGVIFYSEPWGELSGARSAKCSLDNTAISYFWPANFYNPQQQEQPCNPRLEDCAKKACEKSLSFNFYSEKRPVNYKNLYTNFFQKPGSVYIDGNYLMAFYNIAKTEGSITSQKCQIFYKDIFNYRLTEFSIQNRLTNIFIAPIK